MVLVVVLLVLLVVVSAQLPLLSLLSALDSLGVASSTASASLHMDSVTVVMASVVTMVSVMVPS